MKKPIESEYKNWTDYAEVMMEWYEKELKDQEDKHRSQNHKNMREADEIIETVHWNACMESMDACHDAWIDHLDPMPGAMPDTPPHPPLNKVKKV